jgi:hypothetical protein
VLKASQVEGQRTLGCAEARWIMAWKIVGMMAVAATLLGCSIHNQSAIKRVAYDFSDHAYYDRGYAPSPSYAALPAYYEAGIVPASNETDETDETDKADEPSDVSSDIMADSDFRRGDTADGADVNRPAPARSDVEGRLTEVEGTQAPRPVMRSANGGTIARR